MVKVNLGRKYIAKVYQYAGEEDDVVHQEENEMDMKDMDDKDTFSGCGICGERGGGGGGGGGGEL